ncbi:unnamed protein product [Closterium sp. Naga37s-1]|nr:unnamed protein product [Closterium sp. Naga37s-1]
MKSTTRCSQHLAVWEGQPKNRDVFLCHKAPKDVVESIKTVYETKGKAKEDKGKATAAAMEAISGGFGPSGKRKFLDYYGGDAAVAKAKADESLCLFFTGLRIPEHHADHPLFRNMLRAVAKAGPGYVPPGRKYVGGADLQQCRIRIEEGLGPIKKIWGKQGVTIASDMMTDRNERAQANVLLINDNGAMFTESINCGKDRKTGINIVDMLRPIVEELGPQNVVALCTDGGSNYRSVCRKLGEEACGQGERHDKLLAQASLDPHDVEGPELPGGKVLQALRPAGTRFGTQYIAMSRLCELGQKLIVLVTGDLWKGWAVGDREEGAEKFAKEVIDPAWWKSAAFFVKLLQRPYQVMRMTDSSRPGMMGRMYDLMLQLMEDMEKVLDADEQQLSRAEKLRISRILKDRWDNSLACAMHVAGQILNPLKQNEEIFGVDVECTNVFKEFIARAQDFYKKYPAMSGVVGREVDLEAAVTAYLESRGSCGMPKAMEAREKVKQGKQTMEQWWMWHCTEWPELARLARRVLSQPGYVVEDEEEEEEADEADPKVLEDEYEEYPKKP